MDLDEKSMAEAGTMGSCRYIRQAASHRGLIPMTQVSGIGPVSWLAFILCYTCLPGFPVAYV